MSRTLVRAGRLLAAAALAAALASRAEAAQSKEPSFRHGLGQALAGVFFELPRVVIDMTMTEPPVVGTLMGLLAGTASAIQKTFAGLSEMSAGFHPFTGGGG
jgi:hypothetical protein